MPPNLRREQKRQATREEIKSMVRTMMAQQGSAGISLREVSQRLHLSPSALYYYFPNRDELITALILDGYQDLAGALEAARAEALTETIDHQLFVVALACRTWAITHPLDFQLLFGTPIPGYEAPQEQTVPAATKAFLVLARLFENALQQGWKPGQGYDVVPVPLQGWISQVLRQIERDGSSLSPLALYLATGVLTQMHGIVMLELSDHLPSLVGDVATFYQIQIHALIRSLGLAPA
jgi:AcrR family transcriptional regulator